MGENITQDDIAFNEHCFHYFVNYLVEANNSFSKGRVTQAQNTYIYELDLNAVPWHGCKVQVIFSPKQDIRLCYNILTISEEDLADNFYEVLNEINIYSQVGTFVYKDHILFLFYHFRPENSKFNPNVILSFILDACTFIKDLIVPNLFNLVKGSEEPEVWEEASEIEKATQYLTECRDYFSANNYEILKTTTNYARKEFTIITYALGLNWKNVVVEITASSRDIEYNFELLKVKNELVGDELRLYKTLNALNMNTRGGHYISDGILYYRIVWGFEEKEYNPPLVMKYLDATIGLLNISSLPKIEAFLEEVTGSSDFVNNISSSYQNQTTITFIDPVKGVTLNKGNDLEDKDLSFEESLDLDFGDAKNDNLRDIAEYYGYDSEMGISPREFLDDL